MPEASVEYPFEGLVGHPHRRCYTAAELMGTVFPEPRFAVDGIIAEGLSLMAGPPKTAKSFQAANVAVAIASGGRALGAIPVEQGEVLFLALEDSPRRLKGRLEMMLNGDPAPSGLHFYTEWDRLDEGGADQIGEWVAGHPDARLVVVDVFAKVRPRASFRSDDRYLLDYQAAQPLKSIADNCGIAVLCLHHTRKAASDDFVETVSGTFGLAGACDSILVLKRARGQADATLQVTGRDIEEREFALRFAPEIGTWSLLGDAKEWAVHESRRKILEAVKDASQPLTPKQIAAESDVDYGVVKHLVRRMVDDDQLATDGKGAYHPCSPRSPVHSVPPVSERVNRVNDTTEAVALLKQKLNGEVMGGSPGAASRHRSSTSRAVAGAIPRPRVRQARG